MSGRTPGRILQFSRTSPLTPYPFRVKRMLLGAKPRSYSTGIRLHHGTNTTGNRRYHVLPVSGRAVSPLLRRLSGRLTSATVPSIRRSARHHSSARCASNDQGWSRLHSGAIPVTQWDASVDHLLEGRRGGAGLLSGRVRVATPESGCIGTPNPESGCTSFSDAASTSYSELGPC